MNKYTLILAESNHTSLPVSNFGNCVMIVDKVICNTLLSPDVVVTGKGNVKIQKGIKATILDFSCDNKAVACIQRMHWRGSADV